MILDRFYEEVRNKGNVCVGIDTDLDYIPRKLFEKYSSIEDVIFEYNRRIIDATEEYASCFKVQIAYYEALGIEGLKAYMRTLKYIRKRGNIAIADVKRGDIAKTAEMYAKAHFEGDFESDIITLNPYMGVDTIEPYLDYLDKKNKGLFVLLRTSNKGAEDIEDIVASDSKKVYDHVGEKVYDLSKRFMNECGYSSIGFVVGCTNVDEGKRIREKYEKAFFLIPGYGAQGGGGKEAAIYLNDGCGGVVNSSRGILLAYKKHEDGEKKFDLYAREEAKRMKEDIQNAVKLSGWNCSTK